MKEHCPCHALTGRIRNSANVRVSLDGRAVAETVSGKSGAWKEEIPAQPPWANNPRVNLYDASGLPALPFETVIQ